MDSMLTLANFKVVFEFLLRSVDDPYYSAKVDQYISMDNDDSIHYKRMVRYVKEFHEMRRKAVENVMQRLSCYEFGMMLMNAQHVQVYHCIPINGVICHIDKKKCNDGVTLLIDNKKMVCVSKRYEKILYTMFLLMHMSDQIQKVFRQYKSTHYQATVDSFISHSHQRHLKFYYIKLKNMLEYIETNI